MVEVSGGVLDQKLSSEWNKLAQQQEATSTFISQSISRPLDEDLGLVAYFNQKLVIDTLSNLV
jgi:hypothetical protein